MARVSKHYAPKGVFAPERLPVPEPETALPAGMAVPADALGGKDAAQLRQAIAENVWLHFMQMSDYTAEGREARPLVLVRGESTRVWDAEGREYLDGLAGLFCVNAGYGRTEIAQAMLAQLERIHFVSPFSFPNVPGTVLAERLARLSPTGEGSRVFFVTGGSEAVETALKLAKAYHRKRGFAGRYKMISRRYAYHGTTAGALSLIGLAYAKNPYEPLVPGARHVTPPYHYRCPYCAHAEGCTLACADEVRQTIEFEGPESVAAVVMEPVQNSGGCLVPPPGYYERIRETCDEYGVLLIMDEVICGFGRIGTMFGSESFEVRPDIVTIAKGLTSAYAPLGAAIASREIADTFAGEDDDKFQHGITFGGNPVAAAAALANLDILEREDLPGRSRDMGAYFLRELITTIGEHPHVGEVRGRGLFVGIELVRDRETRASLEDKPLLGWLSDEFLRRGIICRADDRLSPVIQFAPPLTIAREDIDRIVTTVAETLDGLKERVGSPQ